MFAVYCPTRKSRQLIWPGQVEGIANLSPGIALQYACGCGETGLWLTGAGVEERLLHHGAVATADA